MLELAPILFTYDILILIRGSIRCVGCRFRGRNE